MDRKTMLEIINSNEYDFLRNEGKLKDKIILLTTGGSYAYGTNIYTKEHKSDFDVRGIYLNSPDEILKMDCSNKPYENRDLDVSIYPLKQIISLLIRNNPNVLEILGTKEEHLLICNEYGRYLRDNSDMFLSQTAYYSFGGYATSQLRRLENALARGEYPQAKKEEHMLKSLKSKINTFEERFTSFDDNSIKLMVKNSNKTGMDKEIFMNINLNEYPLRDFKGIYEEMNCIVKDFDKLNHRNSKKDEVHLLKHAMHLIRLLKMGIEILEGKGINTYRENDRLLLLDIRTGKYSYDEIFEIANILEKDFEYAKNNTSLPRTADIKKINEFVIDVNKDLIKRLY